MEALEGVAKQKMLEQENNKKFQQFIDEGKSAMSIANYANAIDWFKKALQIKSNDEEAKKLLSEAQAKNQEFLAMQDQQSKMAEKERREKELQRLKELEEEERRKAEAKKQEQSEAIVDAQNKVINNSSTSEAEIQALMAELKAQEEKEKYAVIQRQKEMLENWNNAKAQLGASELAKISAELDKLRAAENELMRREPISYQDVAELKETLDKSNKSWQNLSDDERARVKAQLDLQRNTTTPADPGEQNKNVDEMLRRKQDLTTEYKALVDKSDRARDNNYDNLQKQKEYVDMLYIEFKAKKSYVDELAFYKEMLMLAEDERRAKHASYQESINEKVLELKAQKFDENKLTSQKQQNIILTNEQKQQIESFVDMKEKEQAGYREAKQSELEEFDRKRAEELLIRDSQRQDKAYEVAIQKEDLSLASTEKTNKQLEEIKLKEGELLQQKAYTERVITTNSNAFEKTNQEVVVKKEALKAEADRNNKMQEQLIVSATDSIQRTKQGVAELATIKANITDGYKDSVLQAKEALLIAEREKQERAAAQLKQNKAEVENVYVPEQIEPDGDKVLKEKEAVSDFNAAQQQKSNKIIADNIEEVKQLQAPKPTVSSTKIIDETKTIEGNKVVVERKVTIGDKVDVYKMVVAKWGTFYFKNDKSITQDTWRRETQVEESL